MNTTKNQNKAYLYAGLTILFWSTVAAAFKISLGYLHIFHLVAISSLASLMVLFIVIITQGKLNLIWKNTRTDLFRSALYGFINPFLYYLILFKAYSILPAQIAQPVNMTWPIILVIMSSVYLKQSIPRKSYIALFVSFTGVIVTSSHGGLQNLSKINPQGIAIALSSAFVWSFYWILNMKDTRDEVVKLFLNFLFATIYIISACFLINPGTKIDLNGLLSGVYVGLFEMGFSFVCWLKALKLSETTDKVSNLIFITPFVSLIFIRFIVKEDIYWTTFAGLIMIVSGIIIQKK